MSDELADAAAEVERLAREAADLTDLAAGHGASLVPTGSHLPATAVKTQMAEIRAAAVHKSVELREAQALLKRRLDAEMEKAREVLGPLEQLVKRLEEGIWTVNLYLGRDEEIVTLADGDPAPEGTPITLRQMVLNMDEESAIAAEHGGIDARNVAQFDEWLTDPAHLEQVFPEPKGVVVLRPRRESRDYGDAYVNKQMAAANAQSYWLIRNGDRLFRVTTDLVVGDRLIPARDEFTSFFTRREHVSGGEYRTVPLEPGSSEWMKAEESADARQRHYLRIGLVLQGLVDRTTVLHPLPAPTVSFLQPDSYDAGHVVIVTDDDLALGTGREPFQEWQRRLCAELRPGMRIIGAFNTEAFRAENRVDDYGGGGRISPPGASRPESGTIHYLEGRRDDGLYFLYQRTDKRHGYEHGNWGRWGEWEYTRRASCVVYPTDPFILPLDLVNIPDMEMYLTARQDRHAYAELFPLLKSAIAAKRDELELEEPFRKLLAAQIVAATGEDIEDVEAVVPDLVDWWKLSNRWHRPLVCDDDEEQAKALRMIVVEHQARRRVESMATQRDHPTLEMILRAHPDAVLVARKRDGSYIAYTPANDENLFVHEFTWSKTGRARPSTQWARPSPRWRDWTVLHSGKRWDTWDVTADFDKHLTGPELDELIEEIRTDPSLTYRDGTRADTRIVAVTLDRREREFKVFLDDLSEPNGDRLLTRYRNSSSISRVTLGWRRSRTGLSLHDRGRSTAQMLDRWTKAPPWEQRVGYGEVPVFTDETVIFNLTRRLQPHVKLSRRRRELEAVADRARRSVFDAWHADALAMHYARFLEDFIDPDLWEGHQKTLTIRPPDDAHEALTQRLVRVIEEGYDVDGWTVAELDAKFQELCPDRERQVQRRFMSDWWVEATPIPDGFAHRVLSTGDQAP